MGSELLLGDEAVALGAVDAGIAGAFSYPGTPATEIFEAIQANAPEVWAQWSANEKVAYEEALGMSYAGKRSLVSMKHVGLNVAADPFINSALTGVNGGLVLAVADDPGMHSSQNEQDSRFYAEFAKVPCFEPCNQQECYDMTREAFALSERLQIPVVLRLVTRLAHSRANVRPSGENERDRRDLPLEHGDPNDWTLVPANARRRFKRLLSIQAEMERFSTQSPFNSVQLLGKRGILCSGIAYNYVREALGDDLQDSVLKIGTYPLPAAKVRELVNHCDEVMVFEDGYPFIEQRIVGLLGVPGKAIRGRLNGLVPPDGELTPELVASALGVPLVAPIGADPMLAGRAPQLCKGCPHSDTFMALIDGTSAHPNTTLFSDIGCYTLGAMAPYRAVHSCVDMGASISMAHGASRAGAYPVLCTIGDSTFTHSGITPLIGAVRSNADMTVVILDNATTAMTGSQDSMATGSTLVELLQGIGVKDLHVFEPLRKNHEASVELIKKAIGHRGLTVLVAKRACIQLRAHRPVRATEPACEAQGGK